MLERLLLENLVLVDSTEVYFTKGFTVITGETGSGKSILLTAIGLLLGDKADTGAIRYGADVGIIEGDFSLPQTPSISALFAEFSLDPPNICIIRRELFSSGKSRALVNGCIVPINFLKRLGGDLLEISHQHAYLSLQEEQTPRALLDSFAELEKKVSDFNELFEKTKNISLNLEKLLLEEPLRFLEIERIRAQLQEIQDSKIFDINDEDLFSRLEELENAKELLEKVEETIEELEGGRDSLLKRVSSLEQKAHTLFTLLPRFSSCHELIEEASAALREVSPKIQSILDAIEYSEEEHRRVEETLSKIDAVKRKYGTTLEEIERVRKGLLERLTILETRDEVIESLQNEFSSLTQACDEHAHILHEKRIEALSSFEKEILSFLHMLHMPEAEFHVEVERGERNSFGDDNVRFFLKPNAGEKKIEVKDRASGGELARLFLAVQAVMARHTHVHTIIFDEIDASIGGVTATSVGELLSAIGKERQVLAITHFTQVAAQANNHIVLSKETTDGRTLTHIRHLSSKKEFVEEHKRMVGK